MVGEKDRHHGEIVSKCSKAYSESSERAKYRSEHELSSYNFEHERRPVVYPSRSQIGVLIILLLAGLSIFIAGVYLSVAHLTQNATPLFIFSVLLLLPSVYALTVYLGSYLNIEGWSYDDVPRYFE